MNNFIGFDKYKISGAYHWNSIETNKEYIAQSNIIIQEAIDNKPVSILDIGCGDGAISGKLGRLLPESSILGFDAEQDAVSCGIDKLLEFGITNVRLENKTITEAKNIYSDQKFDMLFSLDVIEHLPDPKEMIDFMRAFQNENTKSILLGTPLFIENELMSPYHVTEYTTDQIRSMVGIENIILEWILPGKRKNKITGEKRLYNKSYYICKILFKD